MGIFVLRVICDSDLSVIVNLEYIEIVGYNCDSWEEIIWLVNWQRNLFSRQKKVYKILKYRKMTHYNQDWIKYKGFGYTFQEAHLAIL